MLMKRSSPPTSQTSRIGLVTSTRGSGDGLGTRHVLSAEVPKFTSACQAQDFDAAAKECNISSWRAERNQASVRFFTNAACVVRNPSMYDPTQTYYPQVLVDTIQVTA
jgi:hypothetical protein